MEKVIPRFVIPANPTTINETLLSTFYDVNPAASTAPFNSGNVKTKLI